MITKKKEKKFALGEYLAAHPELISAEVAAQLMSYRATRDWAGLKAAADLLKIPNERRLRAAQLGHLVDEARSAIRRLLLVQERGFSVGLRVSLRTRGSGTIVHIGATGRVKIALDGEKRPLIMNPLVIA